MKKAQHRQSFISRVFPSSIVIYENRLITYKNLYFSVAHGSANYLLTLPPQDIILNTNYDTFYIYLEIDKLSTEVHIKITDKDITDYGYGLPQSYPTNKPFFNLENKKSYIKSIGSWSEIIRINFCKIQNNTIERVYSGISQVGLNNISHKAGEIQFDDNNRPLKVETQTGFKFVTDVDFELLNIQDIKSISLENVKTQTISAQNINKHDLLIRTSEYGIIRGTNISTDSPIIAIALNDASTGDTCFIQEQGFIKDTGWGWSEPPNTKLYCDSMGRLSTTPDWSANSVQEVGFIVDVDTIYFDPKEKLLINSLKSELI